MITMYLWAAWASLWIYLFVALPKWFVQIVKSHRDDRYTTNGDYRYRLFGPALLLHSALLALTIITCLLSWHALVVYPIIFGPILFHFWRTKWKEPVMEWLEERRDE